jgi:phospholipid/cholesterol/gamma-HCH transport system substrate-binding protein
MANREKTLRVGLLIAVSLTVLMISLFFIGSEQKIFARKNEYQVRLDSVTGLAQGNPVKISGVTVGVVKDITLPRDPKQKDVAISLMVDRKYAERIRTDSRARLKKLGLLAGDSYVDITPGNPKFDVVEPGAIIPAQRQTNVDQLISSGEDLVDNLVQISYSLKNVLSRVDRGEGLLGELTTNAETKQRLTDTLLTTLNKTNAILEHVESGKGLVGRLVYDDAYANQLTSSLSSTITSLQALIGNVQHSFDSGNGMVPALLNDPEGKRKVLALVENLRVTSENLANFSGSLKTGQGLVPRLLNDKEYGDQALKEFTGLVGQLNTTVSRINSGEGTAGKLLADPSVYDSVNDILIGINQSKLLRWLIRNRQQKGIQQRYETQSKESATPASPRGNNDSSNGVNDDSGSTSSSGSARPATRSQPAPQPDVVPPPVRNPATDSTTPVTTPAAPPATSTAPSSTSTGATPPASDGVPATSSAPPVTST